MGQLRKFGNCFLLIVFLALLVIFSLRLLGPKIGNTFSTISACLPDSPSCETPPTEVPVIAPTEFAVPTAGDLPGPVEQQLAQIDKLLNESVQSSIAYNVPEAMTLNETVTLELLLNPSVSPTQLADQITQSGQVVTASVEITPMMRANLFPQDNESLIVQPVHADAVQLVSNVDTTRWAWLVTGKRSGAQKLTLVIYRLIRFEGQDYWREVKSYQAEINVEVTFEQRLQSSGWLWVTGMIVAALLASFAWQRYSQQKRRPERTATLRPVVSRERAGHIFISYRRADSADIAGRIYDRLVDEFGRPLIFKDVDSIPLGTNFKEYLDRKVSECNVLLAIIGDRWSETSDAAGKRRLDDPADFVRVEIESALERGIPVIPLLVRGAQMPEEERLPPSLRKLVYQNGIQIRPDPDFHRDMDRLISALDEYLQ